MSDTIYYFRVSGKDADPSRIAFNDLSKSLFDIEKALKIQYGSHDEEMCQSQKLPDIYLVGAIKSSAQYCLKTDLEGQRDLSLIFRSLSEASRVTKDQQSNTSWGELSLLSQTYIRSSLKRFIKAGYTVGVAINESSGPWYEYSEVKHLPEVTDKDISKSRTTRTFEIIRAGGKYPAARLALAGHKYNVTATGSKKIIQSLGQNLYQIVRLEGIAHWRISDWKMMQFDITRVYEETQDFDKSMKELVDLSIGPLKIGDGFDEWLNRYLDSNGDN